MSTPSVVEIDALNSLLEAEASSIFHFVGPGSKYLKKAAPDVRQPLEAMSANLDAHAVEVVHMIRRLGGEPVPATPPDPNSQYLDFLSLKFLLPKLIEAKELMIRRHENVLRSLGGQPEAMGMLQRHLAQMKTDFALLREIGVKVASEGRTSRSQSQGSNGQTQMKSEPSTE